jgi:hypothetical protein
LIQVTEGICSEQKKVSVGSDLLIGGVVKLELSSIIVCLLNAFVIPQSVDHVPQLWS